MENALRTRTARKKELFTSRILHIRLQPNGCRLGVTRGERTATMAETLSHLKAQFIDTAIDPDSSKEKFEAFHSHLVRNVIDGKNDKFSQIVEGNVYRDFLPGETVITVSLIVRDPISKSVRQADRLISDSASEVGINVVDDTPPSEDKYNLEQDGISLISINGPLISIESKSIVDPKRTNELHKDKTAFTGMAKTLKTAENSTIIKKSIVSEQFLT